MRLTALLGAVLLISGPALAAFPEDLETALQSLKDAESKKDAAEVKKLGAELCELARKAAAEPAPADSAAKAAWTSRVEHARSVELYTEYALLSVAAQSPPETTVDLLSTLERQNPKSKYLDDAYGYYFQAMEKTGNGSKIPEVAEKAIAHLPNNADLLSVLADTALNKKQSARAGTYAERLVAALAKRSKPEGMSAADWERRKATALGRGYWIAGIVHMEKAQYFDADKDLRAALPLVKGSDQMMAAALFHLGVANYQLGKTIMRKAQVMEAVKFSEQCAAIKSPFAEQAWRNAYLMKNEAAKMR